HGCLPAARAVHRQRRHDRRGRRAAPRARRARRRLARRLRPRAARRVRRDEVRALLARRGLATRRALGQNFLVDAAVAEAIADAARLAPGDAVLEIGPGLGILTRALAARAARVVAVEIDAGLVRALAEEGGLPPNVELVHGDALALDLAARVARPGPAVRVVANLPYAVGAPILRRLL